MNKKFSEEFSYNIFSKIEQINQPKKLAVLFLVGLIGNMLSWLFGIFMPEIIYNFINDASQPFGSLAFYYFLIFPFVSGFLMGLSATKIFYIRRKKAVDETDFLKGYTDYLQKENTKFTYFIAGIIGGVNCILIVLFTVASYKSR